MTETYVGSRDAEIRQLVIDAMVALKIREILERLAKRRAA